MKISGVRFLIGICGALIGCNQKPATLFQALSPDHTGITFVNRIEERDSFNILTEEYIYNGGGVAVADFNNDGLQDIFFTGNTVPNALYLNQGGLEFKDVSGQANVSIKDRWNSGVSVVDINNDGWMDIYISATMHRQAELRKNMLFINKGRNESGVPVFSEDASAYGIADSGFSVMAAFFDYDRDGDLDLYVLTNERLGNVPTNYRPKLTDGSAANTDRLYENNGDGTFSNVSEQAGITLEGFGLGLAITDVNLDGWPDIYVSNDYLSNDILYVNNKDGSFTNKIADFIGHQSQFSMGNDAADINNDAAPDIITLDMLPETNDRKKTTISNKSYLTYINNEKFNYEYQYVRNMLHLNNGMRNGIPFSEIGQLSGIFQTEWSWSPLFADFDNDGYKDLIITNGFPKDVTDKDFANYRADVGNIAEPRLLIDSIPIVKTPNYAFKNNGDLTFRDVTRSWGLYKPSFSNGAAFADLDNDGDLDYVVNNINEEAFVFENTLYTTARERTYDTVNFLRVKLNGHAKNKLAIGAKVMVYYNGNAVQYQENTVYRGFLSSVETILHFGLDDVQQIDSLVVNWPDGSVQRVSNLKSNQVIQVDHKGFAKPDDRIENNQPRFFNPAKRSTFAFLHQEEDIIDYNLQRTLPHKFSQAGPGIAVGDINEDGLDDVVIGGSTHYSKAVFTGKKDGTFALREASVPDKTKMEEDEGLLLFDANGDDHPDLYIVSGSIESFNDTAFQDRLFLNNGKGVFEDHTDRLPVIKGSGSCVRAADYDRDGDLDLFVAGRVVPGRYPLPAESYLLRNDDGKFEDVKHLVCPDLAKAGMITDALWTDFNNDDMIDLILVGEFTPVMFFQNEGTTFSRLQHSGVELYTGWWNSLAPGDFDRDGDTDYIVGNLGLNNAYQVTRQYPLKVYAKDFDGNGSIDPILACYMRESMDSDVKKLYPVHFWDELNSQSPKFRKKFSRYRQYSRATIDQVLSAGEMKDAQALEANHMATSYVENTGDGKFKLTALPTLVQVAPVNGLITDDVNQDGNLDVLMVGNDYGNEVFAGRHDAFTGLVLLGDGTGTFRVVPSAQSGFCVNGDAKGLVRLFSRKNDLYIATRNRDSLEVLVKRGLPPDRIFVPQTLDAWAEMIYANGRNQKVEFYYGSGYLSQSTRKTRIPKDVTQLIIHDTRGNSRKIDLMGM